MIWGVGHRAYSQGRGESVTRGDRRQRELEFGVRCRRSPAPANDTARVGSWALVCGMQSPWARG